MKNYLLILLLISFTIQADVYRYVDKHGNVSYSDVDDAGSEQVIIDIAPSYTPQAVPVEPIVDDRVEVEKVEKPLYKININTPVHDQTIHNPESIIVSVELSPELNSTRKDQIIFTLDGKQIGEPQTSLNYDLAGIERGSHIIVASIIDKKGKVLKRSKSILFHIQRHSVAR